MSRRGRQTDLQPALQSAMRRLDRKGHGAYTAARVMAAWGSVAAGIVASHTTGVHLRDQDLIIYVDGNSWATHFAAAAEQYRSAINKDLGEELVGQLRFVVSRKVAAEHRLRRADEAAAEEQRKGTIESVPLSETELAQIQASVAEIPDEELRQAVYRATVKDLEWKKGVAAQNDREASREGS
jgi:hypothetical protein